MAIGWIGPTRREVATERIFRRDIRRFSSDKFHESQLPVDVAPSPGPNLWLAVVLPNVILILTIGGFMLFMLRRQRVRGDPNRV